MGELFRKNFTISLTDPKELQDAIDAIDKLSTGITKAMESVCNWLAKKGVTIAREQLNRLCVSPSGRLYDSIRFELSDGGKGIAYVVAGHPDDHMSDNEKYTRISYAVFVEFGYGTGSYYDTTGALVTEQRRIDTRREFGQKPKYGRSKDHPLGRYRSAESYKVMTNAEGDKFLGWKYMDKRTGKWHTSYGQNPKPFMYNTLLELSRLAERDIGGRLSLYLAGSL